MNINTPEFLLSILISIELILRLLLLFKPKIGLLYSGIYFLLFICLIGILHMIGIRELCGNDEAVSKILGLAKILQNQELH